MEKEQEQATTPETFDPRAWWDTIKHRWPILVHHIIETAAQKDCPIGLYCTMIDAEGDPDNFTIYQGPAVQVPAKLQDRRVEFWETRGNTLSLFIPSTELTDDEYHALLYPG